MEVTTALATERHLETLLNAVVSAARRLTAAEGGRILVLDRTGRELHCLVGQNEAAPELSGLARSVPLYRAANSFNLDEPNVYAAVTGRVVNVADVRAYTGLDFTALYAHEAATAFRTRAFVAVPLRSVEGFTLGVLQLINVRMDHRRMDGWPLEAGAAGRALSPDFERVVRCFAAHAAVAIANARLFDENRRLIRQLDRARSDLEEENTRLRNAQAGPGNGVIGDSAPFQVALALLQRAAPATVPVLLLGETGTGKEVFAKMLHAASPRSARPFVVQNCAALPEHLLESELFGYRRGAFTGAIADRAGLVHAAQGGTLFLDEVGDMPLGLQSKILRMLGQGEVRRVGDTRTETVDVRIVAATNADLAAKIAQGQFREDLYYRLQVFPITLPPLRDRTSDIPALIEHFLAAACAPLGRRPPALTPEALACLVNWRFPGNVRELKNIVERAVLLCDGDRLDLPHLPPELMASTALPAPIMTPEEEGGGLRLMVQNYEAAIIEVKLRETGWNQSRAADLLRISRRSLVEKLSRYDIRQPGRV
ncbi:sigma-54-dependent Fis family transcriptional regulator [Xanthobacter agilis]|uniref:Sigma-54-dependent transcriptional regulator n=1 Tax=Xanthobacter agilis TaxID=47492 RepID=A0ABU0LES3_XANAG|nr:sigma 54-interacting transcriptional regulator [Xanthobacter agilis]MDQ0505577.1 sigma-54-dependent transcriptional regulator [Xanthobacter agilis]